MRIAYVVSQVVVLGVYYYVSIAVCHYTFVLSYAVFLVPTAGQAQEWPNCPEIRSVPSHLTPLRNNLTLRSGVCWAYGLFLHWQCLDHRSYYQTVTGAGRTRYDYLPGLRPFRNIKTCLWFFLLKRFHSNTPIYGSCVLLIWALPWWLLCIFISSLLNLYSSNLLWHSKMSMMPNPSRFMSGGRRLRVI